MRLEICHAVSQHSVCNRVRFVEGVAGEGFKEIEHLFCFLPRDAVFCRAFHKFIALCGKQCLVLFPHRRTEDVRLTECEPRHIARNLHHLLLIHTDTIGVVKRVLQRRVHVSHGFQAVLPIDELLHRAAFKRAGAVKCRNRCELLKRIGLQLRDNAIHARGGFQLE